MALSPNEVDKIVAELTSLNERELIETLSRVFDVFAQRFDGGEMNPNLGCRYALVRTSFIKGEDDEPYVKFLGMPTKPFWIEPWDEALDSGRCPTCGVLVASTNKLATCPVCGTKSVECT